MGGIPGLPPYIENEVLRCLESINLSNLFPTLVGENFLFSIPQIYRPGIPSAQVCQG
jgi:hypothetical protein